MSDIIVKKIVGVDLLSSDGAHPVASVANDTGKNLLPLAVYVKGNDVSGVTWGAEVGFSTSNEVADGNPWLNVFNLKQITKELTDGGPTVALFDLKDAGPDCQLLDTDTFYLWCTRPAMASAYTVDFYIVCVAL